MNPAYAFHQYVAAPTLPPTPGLATTGLAGWLNQANDNLSGSLNQAAANINPIADIEKTLTDNLPNFLIGGIGLFMILVGIGAVAAPVAKELI